MPEKISCRGKIVNKVRKLIKYIIVFLVPIVCMVIHMYLRECYPFGDNTILLGDANAQYYWFEKMLLEKIKNGESILFSWQAGMGFEFYQNFFYYLGSPFNVIAMIIGNWDMELGVVVTMLIQIGMCSATMLYYLGHTSRNTIRADKMNVPLCMTFAVAYSMCDYIIAYQYNYIWLISLMLAPIVMLGVERLTEGRGAGFYIVTLTLVFITNFYFAWFICILSFVWYVDCCRGTVKQVLRITGRYIGSSVWAAVISAFVLVPCFLAVKGRGGNVAVRESSVKLDKWGNVGEFIYGFFWGSPVDQAGHGYFNNNNYVGIAVLLLGFMYLFNKKVDLRARIRRAVEIVILSVSLNWMVTSYIFHGFTLPNSYSNRFAFILSIIFLITAFEELVNIDKVSWGVCTLTMILLTIGVVAAIVTADEVGDALTYIVTIMIDIFCIICFVLYSRESVKIQSIRVCFTVVFLFEIISNYFMVMGDAYEISQENERNTNAWIEKYNSISLENGERKSSWLNSQKGMGNTEAGIFTSVINRDMLRLFSAVGLSYQNNNGSYTYKGTTPLTAMMFNVKDVVTDHGMYFGGYKRTEENTAYNSYLGSDITYGIYHNDYIVGTGFVVDDTIADWNNEEGNPFETQNEFVKEAFGLENVFEKADISGLTKSPFGCEVTRNDGLSVSYRNIWPVDGLFLAANTYKFVTCEDMHLYIYAEDPMGVVCSVYIDDEPFVIDSSYISSGEMIDLGWVKKGQNIRIKVANNSKSGYESTTSIEIYKYNDQVMQNAMEKNRASVYNVKEHTDTYVSGTVNAESDGILYTSIPCFTGTTMYVDGEKTDIVRIGGALCGAGVTAGKHEVTFTYFPYGLKLGIIISCLGIAVSLAYWISSRKKAARYKI